jgi:hypothetical protein
MSVSFENIGVNGMRDKDIIDLLNQYIKEANTNDPSLLLELLTNKFKKNNISYNTWKYDTKCTYLMQYQIEKYYFDIKFYVGVSSNKNRIILLKHEWKDNYKLDEIEKLKQITNEIEPSRCICSKSVDDMLIEKIQEAKIKHLIVDNNFGYDLGISIKSYDTNGYYIFVNYTIYNQKPYAIIRNLNSQSCECTIQ